MTNANNLYAALGEDDWGRIDYPETGLVDIMYQAESEYTVRLTCLDTSPHQRELVQLAHSFAETNFSERTNNDATDIIMHASYDPQTRFFHVTATITDWVS